MEVETNSRTFSCDGLVEPGMGHPRVYLIMEENEDKIVCPYCSTVFKLKK